MCKNMKSLRPKHLFIECFRNFKDVSLDLGDKLTVISGQNGVGKSNIISLIASGSGISKTSTLGSKFQPEFYDFFNIDKDEDYENYKLFLSYVDEEGNDALTKRLSFKDDSDTGRGIRIIPRTSNVGLDNCTIKKAEEMAKEQYGVGGAARVQMPTIYLSLSRLYPLGESKQGIIIKNVSKKNALYHKKANEKYKEWYNYVIPNSIKSEASLSLIDKKACSRPSLHMDIVNTPTLSQSIGQDNIGNIISALVDIYLLSLEEGYRGAVICIDEVDVSLHPDTQIRLLGLFDALAKELSIHFIVSTHSLTVLKETLIKERKNSTDYSVVYIKNPAAPYISDNKTYELLKSDMFGSLSFKPPKVRIYFEDLVGQKLFELLMQAFDGIFRKTDNKIEEPVLRNQSSVFDYGSINSRIISLKRMTQLTERVNLIPTKLGCEELFKISHADSYFKRIIFVLDGDARYYKEEQKPKICDYLEKKYSQKEFKLNDRSHMQNICFLPDYFAPESFLYAIIYKLVNNPLKYMDFWRSLDEKEETALYTSDKINTLFSGLRGNFNNDDLKNIFGEEINGDVWDFVCKSDILKYYYEDYENIGELLDFIDKIKIAYDMALPLTIANKYN